MRDTKQFFDKYAYDFDALHGTQKNLFNRIVNPAFRKSMRLRFEKTMAYAHPIEGKTVLDVGCGPGHYAVAFAKAGAKKVVGLDFAPRMIEIATRRAEREGVCDKCEFIAADVLEFKTSEKFDYSVLMGFMDYVADPARLIDKVIGLTEDRILLSFPRDGGVLATQRRLRYQRKCPLCMYEERDLAELFKRLGPLDYKMERISRDFFVTLFLKSK
jgi:SAM-dependent methyltransferase